MDFSQRRRVDQGMTPGLRQAKQTTSRQARTPSVRNLRKPRHGGLLEAIHRLDAGLDQATRDELARWIRDQYTVEYGDIPMGFVAKCYLGPPYVDHRLDLMHDILDHHSIGQPMPEPFEGARMLARSGSYTYIEVYSSGLFVPVMEDGTAVVSGTSS
jgi:hypothetical protein